MILIPELFSVISEELLSFDTHYITTEKTLSTFGKKTVRPHIFFLQIPALPKIRVYLLEGRSAALP